MYVILFKECTLEFQGGGSLFLEYQVASFNRRLLGNINSEKGYCQQIIGKKTIFIIIISYFLTCFFLKGRGREA